MLFAKFKIKRGVKLVVLLAALFSLAGFADKKQRNRRCNKIIVNVDDHFENYFINKQEVISIITDGQSDVLIGKLSDEINLKELEQKLYKNRFVEKARVSRSLNGNLVVEIEQARPIARIIRRDGQDVYISNKGTLLPVSSSFTARVLVIEDGDKTVQPNADIMKSESFKSLCELANFIYEDKFWKAQIAYLYVNSKNEVKMYPQIGKHYIEFGRPVDIRKKFKKLKVFYRDILPVKGWNRYEKVILKYQNQIICE